MGVHGIYAERILIVSGRGPRLGRSQANAGTELKHDFIDLL